MTAGCVETMTTEDMTTEATGGRAVASTWNETRAKRPPREGRVAEHRAQIDAEVRAYRLKEIREEQGLTQVELAERMHVTQPSVSDLERGALDRAGLSTIRAYVEALGGKIEIIADFGDHRVVLG
jgi:predicted XRE-type DNA-binding protein